MKKTNVFKRYRLVIPKLCFVLFLGLLSSCQNDETIPHEDQSVTNVDVSNYKIYYFGNDTDFEKMKGPSFSQQGVDMTQISSEKELSNIIEKEDKSFMLFVGKDIDIRKGMVDDLRNSGTIVPS
ncbi:hypothetical protein [Kordia sp.]|uniref:hypothetical protein n=1 Tax=Kordia sp. TaxID=1965332 RepID=UPI0025BCA3B0|nr:hypothetical protein [Kordia sp.]MCH2195849.1 hypothetical protein [Kordia sp.]